MNKTHDELCQEVEMLRTGIRQMSTLLVNREWADQFNTDPDLVELEIAILRLTEEHNAARDMAKDRAAMVGLIAQTLGVSDEPHQGRDARILEAAQRRRAET